MANIKSTHPAVANAVNLMRSAWPDSDRYSSMAERFENVYNCKVHVQSEFFGADYVTFETDAELTMFLLKYGK